MRRHISLAFRLIAQLVSSDRTCAVQANQVIVYHPCDMMTLIISCSADGKDDRAGII
jgi:hypothetical protein